MTRHYVLTDIDMIDVISVIKVDDSLEAEQLQKDMYEKIELSLIENMCLCDEDIVSVNELEEYYINNVGYRRFEACITEQDEDEQTYEYLLYPVEIY